MARELKTGWQVIATSGTVVFGKSDGRTIKKEWLEDMAEVYNTKLNTAQLWPDHSRYWFPAGKVLALKVEEATLPELDGEIQLHGIFAPTDSLIEANKRGHFLFPSIEVGEDFHGTGKFFLRGIGVVDEPASIGVSELKFSVNEEEDKAKFIFMGEKFDLSKIDVQKTILSRAQEFFSLKQPTQESDLNHEEDNDMKDEQFNSLETSLTAMSATIENLATSFSAVADKLSDNNDDNTDKDTDEDKTAKDFQTTLDDISKTLADLKTENKALKDQFKALTEDETDSTDTEDEGGDQSFKKTL